MCSDIFQLLLFAGSSILQDADPYGAGRKDFNKYLMYVNGELGDKYTSPSSLDELINRRLSMRADISREQAEVIMKRGAKMLGKRLHPHNCYFVLSGCSSSYRCLCSRPLHTFVRVGVALWEGNSHLHQSLLGLAVQYNNMLATQVHYVTWWCNSRVTSRWAFALDIRIQHNNRRMDSEKYCFVTSHQ